MSSRQSVQWVKGEDAVMLFTIREADSDTAAVLNIAGWTFAFKVKRQEADADTALVATGVPAIVDAPAGQVQVTVAAASTALMEGDYRYSLWRLDTGAVSCLAYGPFSVLDSTQDA